MKQRQAKTMTICFITDFYPGIHKQAFGAEIACKRVRDLCVANGHKLHLLTVNAGGKSVNSSDNLNLKTVPIMDDYIKKAGFTLKILFPFDILSYKTAKEYFGLIKPDIVHLHNIKYLSFGPLIAAKERNIPVVFSIYDNWALCPNYNLVDKDQNICTRFHGAHCINCVSSIKKPLVLFRKSIFSHFLNKIDTFLLLTNGERNKFLKYGIDESKLQVLPLPLFDNDNLELDEKLVEKDSILFAGRIDPDKGLHVLIKSMPLVVKKNKNARLRIIGESVGDGKYRKSIELRVKSLGLDRHVEFLGKKNNEQIKQYLKKAHVVVIPEQWGIAWPIFMTEAMVSGKVIVASDIGDIREFIEDGKTGYLANPKDPNDFAERINYSLNKGALMNYEARTKLLKVCDKESIYNKLFSVYEGLCKSKEGV